MAYHKTAYPDTYGQLKEWARENRQYPTEAERCLWERLKGSQLGHKFLRQHIIGDYIADFLCRDDGLIIEVDGGYHLRPDQQEDDEVRTAWLTMQGFHVIRFTNEEVLQDTDRVINEIENQLK